MMDEKLNEATEIIKLLIYYFQSGNSVPVERAVIRSDSELIRRAREFLELENQ